MIAPATSAPPPGRTGAAIAALIDHPVLTGTTRPAPEHLGIGQGH